MRPRFLIAAALLGLLVWLATPAGANHTAPTILSQGTINGNGAEAAIPNGNSSDGTKLWFSTEEALVAGDTDTLSDIYERAGGVTTQISVGPNGYNGEFVAGFKGASEDGSRIFMQTNEPLVASDTDDDCGIGDVITGPCYDVYEYSNGTTTLVSSGGNGAFHVSYKGNSADGTRVFFRTEEKLSASDTDDEGDIYQRFGGGTTLLTTGPAGGNGALEGHWRGSSRDGTRVFFDSDESLVTSDTDSTSDTYERSGGTTTLLSTGPAGGNGSFDAAWRGSSKDGSHVFIETEESLVASDSDSAVDVYDRSGGTTTLISAGTGSNDSLFEGSSDGGTRVFFTTTSQLTGADTDSQRDVYERSGGTSTLISTGPNGGNGSAEAIFQAASADGSTVVFGTNESLVAADTDGRFDLYSRTGGTTSLVSMGSGSFNGSNDAFFRDLSTDGKRVIFETIEQLETSDTDLFPDVYERFANATTRLSTGASGGNGGTLSVFSGASDDATRVFFQTGEQLESVDTDSQTDAYQAAVNVGYARPKAATPLNVPLVPSYQSCTTTNRAHAPSLNYSSCSPPVQETARLQVGTPDANLTAVKSVNSLKFVTQLGNTSTPADEADVTIVADINDVYTKPPNTAPLVDYTGEIGVRVGLQITDKSNGSVPQDPGTVSEFVSGFTVPCVATPDTSTGASCFLSTTADTLVPGMVKESARTMWQLGQIFVADGGADNVALTDPNSVFMRQGIFVP
jgi:hypothetical protein